MQRAEGAMALDALRQAEESALALSDKREADFKVVAFTHTLLGNIRRLNDMMKHSGDTVSSDELLIYFEIDELINAHACMALPDENDKRILAALVLGWRPADRGAQTQTRSQLSPLFPQTISAAPEALCALTDYARHCSTKARRRLTAHLSGLVAACKPFQYMKATNYMSLLARAANDPRQVWDLIHDQRCRTLSYYSSGPYPCSFTELEGFIAHGFAADHAALTTLRALGLQEPPAEALQRTYLEPYGRYVRSAFAATSDINMFISVIAVLSELAQRIHDQTRTTHAHAHADAATQHLIEELPTHVLQPLAHSLNLQLHEHVKSLVSAATHSRRLQQAHPIRLTSSFHISLEACETHDPYTAVPQRGIATSVVNLLRSLQPLLPLYALRCTPIEESAVPAFQDQMSVFIAFICGLVSFDDDVCTDYMSLGSLLYMRSQLIADEDQSSRGLKSQARSFALYQLHIRLGRAINTVKSHIVRRHELHCRSYILAGMHKGVRGYSWQRAESIFQIKSASNPIINLYIFLKGTALDMRSHLPFWSWAPLFLEVTLRCCMSAANRFSYISPSRGMARQYKVDLTAFVMCVRAVVLGIEALLLQRPHLDHHTLILRHCNELLSRLHDIVHLSVLQLMVLFGSAAQIGELVGCCRGARPDRANNMDTASVAAQLLSVESLRAALHPVCMDFSCDALNPAQDVIALDKTCQELVDLEAQPRALGEDWAATIANSLSPQQLLLLCSKRPELREDESPALTEEEAKRASQLKHILMSTEDSARDSST